MPARLDLTGMRFGRLTALRIASTNSSGVHWICVCDCGAQVEVHRRELRKGDAKSCGCLTTTPNNLVGRRFGMWTVVSQSPSIGQGTRWLCRCDCGTERVVLSQSLSSGSSRSCGCKRAASAAKTLTKHGDTANGNRTPEFAAWADMKERCLNPKRDSFKSYGNRGIRVCERWLESFENFLADMGRRPSSKHSIDRIDNDGGYEPGNCRWATKKEQARNRRPNRLVTALGKTQCVAAWAEETGLSVACIRFRLNHGWAANDAMTIPSGGSAKKGRAA